jgi:hypothetical protein
MLRTLRIGVVFVSAALWTSLSHPISDASTSNVNNVNSVDGVDTFKTSNTSIPKIDHFESTVKEGSYNGSYDGNYNVSYNNSYSGDYNGSYNTNYNGSYNSNPDVSESVTDGSIDTGSVTDFSITDFSVTDGSIVEVIDAANVSPSEYVEVEVPVEAAAAGTDDDLVGIDLGPEESLFQEENNGKALTGGRVARFYYFLSFGPLKNLPI